MPSLVIELKKIDGPKPSLACVRPDGSRTWARLHPFFPAHDLTHCAVESVLGFQEAFFGLVSQGWDLDDFARPGAAKRLPAEAIWAEHLVGLLERRIAQDADGLNEALEASLASGPKPPTPLVSPMAFAAIQELRAHLIAAWGALPVGETLLVNYPAAMAPGARSMPARGVT